MRKSSQSQEWEKRLETQAKSGVSAAAWMRDNKISEGEFYYWKRKLKQDIKSEGAVKWQALNLVMPQTQEPAHHNAQEMTIEIDAAIITVRKGFDETMLRSVLDIVRA